IDSRGDLYRELALRERAAFAVAVGARVGDHFAASTAGRAPALDDEKALLRPDLAHSAAGGAALRTIVRARAAAPVAHFAAGMRLNGDGFFDARERFLEAQLNIVPQVGPARRIL